MSIAIAGFMNSASDLSSSYLMLKAFAAKASDSTLVGSTASATKASDASQSTVSTFASMFQELVAKADETAAATEASTTATSTDATTATETCPHCGKSSDVTSTDATYAGTMAEIISLMNSLFENYAKALSAGTASSSVTKSATGTSSVKGSTGTTGTSASTAATSTTALSKMSIKWPKGQDISAWDETVKISNLKVANGKISWDETGARDSWGVKDGLNGNAWIIQKGSDGSYSAQTWEYLRKGQTTKSTENIESKDVMDNPPKSGDRVGIMVAGITRDSKLKNVEERSNVQWITWP